MIAKRTYNMMQTLLRRCYLPRLVPTMPKRDHLTSPQASRLRPKTLPRLPALARSHSIGFSENKIGLASCDWTLDTLLCYDMYRLVSSGGRKYLRHVIYCIS